MRVLLSFFLLFFVSIAIFGGVYLLTLTKQESITIISPLAEPITHAVESVKTRLTSELDQVVTKSLTGTKGTYAVIIKNNKTGEVYSQHEKEKIASASLYKLWILAVTYKQLDTGTLKKDQTISESAERLNDIFDIASESAEISTGRISYTVEDATEQMITVSHNYAALLLTNKVRLSNVKQFLQDNSFTNSSTGSPPKTSTEDIALFYEKLYNGDLITKSSDLEMLEILKRQKLNDRIPKYLPANVKVAHKTGEIDGFKHDAGIVYAPFGDYIFVVLSDSDNPKAAAERIAILSRDVYTYFEQRAK